MPVKPPQRWFLKEWIAHRKTSQEKVRLQLGMSKSRMSALATGSERYNSDHLWEFAEILDCEPWELINRNPLKPPPANIASIEETVRRIPIDDRERAIRAAQRMLEEFATAPPSPPSAETPRRKRRA